MVVETVSFNLLPANDFKALLICRIPYKKRARPQNKLRMMGSTVIIFTPIDVSISRLYVPSLKFSP